MYQAWEPDVLLCLQSHVQTYFCTHAYTATIIYTRALWSTVLLVCMHAQKVALCKLAVISL